MRRLVLISSVLLSVGAAARAEDTAYKALRAVGVKQGEKSLDHIVSISGRSGHPQPINWTVLVDDPSARGGLREFDVVASRINAERAPVKRSGGKPIDLSNLNTDSDGAFTVAEAEARRHHVGFDALDYTLASDPVSGKPVWTVSLLDDQQRLVGAVKISADNGNVLAGKDWVPANSIASVPRRPPSRTHDADQSYAAMPTPAGPDSQADRGAYVAAPGVRTYADSGRVYPDERSHYYDQQNAYVQAPPPPPSDSYYGNGAQDEGLVNTVHRYGETVVRFGETVVNKTERAARRIGGWFQKKFTGQDTISPEATGETYYQGSVPPDPYSQPVRPVPPDDAE
ncbi:MAG: hypothetical protein JOY92_10420 [Verrucomicrobia bacterium]|nr:hypothetical protein [Verrucomicrobiota bacterium]